MKNYNIKIYFNGGDIMFGTVIDINSSEAFIENSNGFIITIPILNIPNNIKIGDNINLLNIEKNHINNLDFI